MASRLQPAQDGDGEGCGRLEGARRHWAVHQVWPFGPWTCLGTLENSLPLCASVSPCEMERWDVTHGFQISSSKTLSFKQNPAVLVLPQQKWEAGPAANESPALRGALPHPHHSGPPLQGPWGTRGLFGTHSGLWCQSPSPSSIS